MWTLLPAVSFAALLLTLSARTGSGDMLKCWRESFLAAAIVTGLFIVASSEFLSIFHALSRSWLVVIWTAGGAVSVSCCVLQLLKTKPRLDMGRASWPMLWTLPILGVIAIVIAVGLTAVVAPPNNWDSMTYHMSRVAHWAQNRTLALYPTHIPRQLPSAPGAELTLLHLYVLNGTDRFVNLVQWFSMLGSIIGTSLIAKQLGANLKGQILASVAAATIPMGILQGSTTQNDYVVSFWLVCFVGSALSTTTAGHRDWTRMLAVGGGLGLALITKPTAFVFAAPFAVWLGLRELRSGWKRGMSFLSIVAIIAVAVNVGFYMRNMWLNGSPLGLGEYPPADATPSSTANSIWTGPSIVSNMARNLAQQMGTPSGRVNRFIDRTTICLHRFLGIGISDPRTTFRGSPEFRLNGLSFHEDLAGNPLHVLLIASVILLLLSTPQLRGRRVLLVYATAMVSQLLIYSLLLRWQLWGSRLQLPMFVLWAPLVGAVMSRALKTKVGFLTACVLLVLATPYVLWNSARPLTAWTAGDLLVRSRRDIWHVDRDSMYFSNGPWLLDSYTNAARFVKSTNCTAIGLLMGENDLEYPFWVLLHAGDTRAVRIEHVGVEAAWGSTNYPLGPFRPGVIIRSDGKFGRELVVGRDVYVQRWSDSELSVLVKEADPDSAGRAYP
jgi:hypothetical protein